MVVCPFFLQGRCKFGNNCKNEHPGQAQQNSFAALGNNSRGDTGGGRNRSGGANGGDRYRPGDRNRNQKLPYHLDRDAVAADLEVGGDGERPRWLLSSYGPGRDASRQLLEGALEQSQEEMRVMCYIAVRDNKLQDYLSHEASLGSQAQQQAQTIKNDLDSALKYVIDGEQQHPNRIDQVANGSGASWTSKRAATGGGFGQPSLGMGTSPFGKPSAPSGLGQQAPAFGQPSQATGTFGQPSSIASKPAFGQPSQQHATFGAPSQPGNGGTAFGAPSGLGASRPAFGAPSQPGFGQSGFGQAANSAFAAPSQPAGSSPFGAGQHQQANPFAAAANQPSAFGQASQAQSQQASPFAPTNRQTNGFGSAGSQAGTNPFAPKTGAPAFGQPSQPNGSPFAQAAQSGNSGFGHPAAPAAISTGFGQPSGQSAPPTGMDMSSPTAPVTITNGGFGMAAQGSSTAPTANTQTNGTALVVGIPGTSSYTTRGPDGKSLRTWKNQPVTYDREQNPWVPYYKHPHTKTEERIWHPDGVPEVPNPDAEAADADVYLGDLGKLLEELYGLVKEKGAFEHGGLVPEVPPKREWVEWDL
ncbi:hypothetical protein LTR53_009541 [Teratosphaeriaceae sp. CCFEE 6253]|nr:hypothetical protein LTR53_009541 [Teratosphaeriaceae sp. CCFEE 6253]